MDGGEAPGSAGGAGAASSRVDADAAGASIRADRIIYCAFGRYIRNGVTPEEAVLRTAQLLHPPDLSGRIFAFLPLLVFAPLRAVDVVTAHTPDWWRRTFPCVLHECLKAIPSGMHADFLRGAADIVQSLCEVVDDKGRTLFSHLLDTDVSESTLRETAAMDYTVLDAEGRDAIDRLDPRLWITFGKILTTRHLRGVPDGEIPLALHAAAITSRYHVHSVGALLETGVSASHIKLSEAHDTRQWAQLLRAGARCDYEDISTALLGVPVMRHRGELILELEEVKPGFARGVAAAYPLLLSGYGGSRQKEWYLLSRGFLLRSANNLDLKGRWHCYASIMATWKTAPRDTGTESDVMSRLNRNTLRTVLQLALGPL